MTAKVHAVHKHNCARCRWLATIAHANVQVNACDLYLCLETGLLIARYADTSAATALAFPERPMHQQGPDDIIQAHPDGVHDLDIPELILALDLAIMHQLLDAEGHPIPG